MSASNRRLAGKVAIIKGAAQEQGVREARRFVAEGASEDPLMELTMQMWFALGKGPSVEVLLDGG